MDYIYIMPNGSQERKQLETAAAMLTLYSPCKYIYYVSETYFDYGQGWKWTTILCSKPDSRWGDYQALSPRNQEQIIEADSPEKLAAAVSEVFSGKFCPDRKKS